MVIPPETRPMISGVILTGGTGRRMGGVEKGLIPLWGKPMITQAITRLQPQVDELLISANHQHAAYAQFGYPVLADAIAGGPLAGLHRAMQWARHPWLVSVPCDVPRLPTDLVARLLQHLGAADAAYARVEQRAQPVFCLCRVALLPQLERYLHSGERKVGDWLTQVNAVSVAFDDTPQAFTNINTPEQLAATLP